ncbi:MAG: hypothetical protein AAB383_04170 [Patescibacteria group bacterium]|mgnify:CR=1 FL=1
MTDEELYEKARLYGQNALLWRQRFMGLLPEVEKRRLYATKGFGSVFEFAFKLAGLSEEQVRTALNLEKRFSDKPALKALLEKGEVSINKLVRIQSVVTPENEAFWAQQVQLLPKKALETLVRDERSLPGQMLPLQISQDVKCRLEKLQEKGIDVSELLTELLDRHEQEIAEEKAAIAAELPESQSRHVPVRTQRVLHKEHGTKCSIQTCKRPAEHLHHTQTFAISHRHDPHYLAPLCKEHHIIAHTINVKVQERRALSR